MTTGETAGFRQQGLPDFANSPVRGPGAVPSPPPGSGPAPAARARDAAAAPSTSPRPAPAPSASGRSRRALPAAKTHPSQLGADDHAKPSFTVPDLPDPQTVVSKPCASSPHGDGIDVPPQEAPHAELRSLVSSGYLERLGFDYEPPALGDVFREPDSLRKALGA